MCHRSVGLVQGEIERSGISTVSISVRPDVTFGTNVPRAACLRFPHGNPLGEPHRPDQHHLILDAVLRLLEGATGAPALVELPVRWKRWEKWL